MSSIDNLTITQVPAQAEALRAQVPCGPINTLADVFADPHVQARGMEMRMEHPVGGSIPIVASPMRFSDTPVTYRTAPPPLGHDTEDVLRDALSLSDAQIEELKQKGVLG